MTWLDKICVLQTFFRGMFSHLQSSCPLPWLSKRSRHPVKQNRRKMKTNIIWHSLKLSRSKTKPIKWPAKTQICLGTLPVQSKYLLSAWRNLGSLATHWAHSKLRSDWADAKASLSLYWIHRSFCWFCRAQAQIAFDTWNSTFWCNKPLLKKLGKARLKNLT